MPDTIFADFQGMTLFDVLLNVLLSFVIGFFISLLYRTTYTGYSYSSSFVNALVILAMVTAIVIMVIGNNLARAFGLVGAMSIIRFRTVVKDTRDITFVFFALAGGMAAGSGNHLIGIAGTGIVGIVLLVFYLVNYGSVRKKELLLRFYMVPQNGEENIFLPVFREHLHNFTLLNIKSVRLGQFLEFSFHIRLKDVDRYQRFINDLNGIEGIERVSMVFSGNEEEDLG